MLFGLDALFLSLLRCLAVLLPCWFSVLSLRFGSTVEPSEDICVIACFGSIESGIARHEDGGDRCVNLVDGNGVSDDVGIYSLRVDIGVGSVRFPLTNAIFSHAGARRGGANLRRCYDTVHACTFFILWV